MMPAWAPPQPDRERVPPWGAEETRDLIAIRGRLERGRGGRRAGGAAGSNTLWEAVAAEMRDRGHRRTAEQCKCKWKNLLNRYKGKETADADSGKPCPFFEELHAVYSVRAQDLQRELLESESGTSTKRPKRPLGERSSEELSEGDEYGLEDTDDEHLTKSKRRKDRRPRRPAVQPPKTSSFSSIQDLLQNFLQQQHQMDVHRQEMMERRAQERMAFEQEWRHNMERLERERLMMEQAYIEREEQRRMREEARAERRDALLTRVLNKLLADDNL